MGEMIVFWASISEFDSPEHAFEAVQFNREYIQARDGADIPSVSVTKIGDETIAAQGTITQDGQSVIVAFVWVVKGNYAYYFRGGSGGYNSLPDVVALAQTTLESHR
jgi:hypothetical protein